MSPFVETGASPVWPELRTAPAFITRGLAQLRDEWDRAASAVAKERVREEESLLGRLRQLIAPSHASRRRAEAEERLGRAKRDALSMAISWAITEALDLLTQDPHSTDLYESALRRSDHAKQAAAECRHIVWLGRDALSSLHTAAAACGYPAYPHPFIAQKKAPGNAFSGQFDMQAAAVAVARARAAALRLTAAIPLGQMNVLDAPFVDVLGLGIKLLPALAADEGAWAGITLDQAAWNCRYAINSLAPMIDLLAAQSREREGEMTEALRAVRSIEAKHMRSALATMPPQYLELGPFPTYWSA